MKISYLVTIENPSTHQLKVKINLKDLDQLSRLKFFLPVWSPGSYMIRDYSRHLSCLRAIDDSGNVVPFTQEKKNVFLVSLEKTKLQSLSWEYQVYCYEHTVRTSIIDDAHAFLHGPSYLMGIEGALDLPVEIEFRFPPCWSKIHLGLSDISQEREKFLYYAPNYDVLIDAPVEIGCHESDGFIAFDRPHHLVFQGEAYPSTSFWMKQFKNDFKLIVETVAGCFSSIPYDSYTFITHFAPDIYGGLEHLNSTALHFDGRKLGDRKKYLQFLALVAHEYFHTWNVKRIRPEVLGPFDYHQENYTTLHWLTEGLTSFMDEWLVLKAGLCSIEEYLDMQVENLNRYFQTPGRRFHSVEDSSFNAWIKLYRPDENSRNSSISYYLKGGLLFAALHMELKSHGKSLSEFLTLLWQRYLANPQKGMSREEVLTMIEDLAGAKVKELFDKWISTTEDVDFESYYKQMGMNFVWSDASDKLNEKFDIGATLSSKEGRVVLSEVILDGPAYQSGLWAQDEIISLGNWRFLPQDINDFSLYLKTLRSEGAVKILACRKGRLFEVSVIPRQSNRVLKKITVDDKKMAAKCFEVEI